MTINDIMELDIRDINAMNRQELARAVSQLNSAANKRVKRLKEAGVWRDTPAYAARPRGEKFSVKGKNVNQLRTEFKRAKNFLEKKTSTLKGFHEVRQEAIDRLGEFRSRKEERDFWADYRKVVEMEKGGVKVVGSDQVQRRLRQETTKHKSKRRLMESMHDFVSSEYEKQEEGRPTDEDAFVKIRPKS